MAGFFGKLTGIFGRSSEERWRRSQIRRLQGEEGNLVSVERDKNDALQALKEEVCGLEARARAKKRELENTRGESKRIVIEEIEMTFAKIDMLKGREAIVVADLRRTAELLARVRELFEMIKTGQHVSAERIDGVTEDAREVYAERRDLDQAAAELQQETYTPPKLSRGDVENRLAEVQPESTPGTTAGEPESETPIALSPDTEKRLRRLEAEGG